MSNADKNWKNRVEVQDANGYYVPVVFEGRQIPVAEVREGMEIVSRHNTFTGRIIKTVKVTDRKPCDGGNGMHVHLNKSDCYDSRQMVWVK